MEPMSRLPAAPSPAKPAVPRSVLLAEAKVTIRAPIPRVFEAILDPEQLVQWWGDDPRVDAELGGRYEGTFSDGRIEGSITAIDGPGQLSFMWPIPQEGGSVETSVAYELAPKGPETVVHLVHPAPRPVPAEEDYVGRVDSERAKAVLMRRMAAYHRNAEQEFARKRARIERLIAANHTST